jgi:hypothetical protein
MARYFFDVRRDELRICGDVGIDLPDEAAIWPEIARLIQDCVYAAPDGPRVFDVVVRDESGDVVFRSTTTLPDDPPAERPAACRGPDRPEWDLSDRTGLARPRPRSTR